MRSNKSKAKRKAARVGGTMFEYIGTSKAWNPSLHTKYKYRDSGRVGEAASEVRKIEVTDDLARKYINQ